VSEPAASLVELDRALATVRDRIAKHQRQSIGEQDTKAALIVPVLRALGWDLEDLEDVKLEYKRLSSDNPVDYSLFLLRAPRLFIEAKALGVHLDDHKWTSQILNYATVAGVEWVALTDGNEWRIYNSHAVVPVEQKLFRIVRVADPDTRPGETLALLSKSGLQDKIIETLWKTEVVDRQVRPALDGLFSPEIPADFVRLIHRRVPELAIADVRASLARARIIVDYPAIHLGRTAAAEAPVPTPASDETGSGGPEVGSGTPWRHVTLGQLITAGLVRVPFDIEHRYRGAQLAARIEDSSRIVFQGSAYDSLSTAGGVARKSIAGPFPGRDIPQTNGWTFWQFRGSDGTLHVLDDLRRELHERKVVNLIDGRRAEA
jgi:hypothetical protein